VVQELPVVAAAPVAAPGVERADAARNRQKILAAAEELIAERGVEHVSMDDVARAACVGKGTLYRRFGDRAGLARALLDEREGAFQEECIRGAAPLGPGAPAGERLLAFGQGYFDLLETHGHLLTMSEWGVASRYQAPPYAFYRVHVAVLLAEACPGADADVLAEALMAFLAAGLFGHLRRNRGVELERLVDGWEVLVRGVLAAAPAPAAAGAATS
jgi:AcrR family transcriptional regulator